MEKHEMVTYGDEFKNHEIEYEKWLKSEAIILHEQVTVPICKSTTYLPTILLKLDNIIETE